MTAPPCKRIGATVCLVLLLAFGPSSGRAAGIGLEAKTKADTAHYLLGNVRFESPSAWHQERLNWQLVYLAALLDPGSSEIAQAKARLKSGLRPKIPKFYHRTKSAAYYFAIAEFLHQQGDRDQYALAARLADVSRQLDPAGHHERVNQLPLPPADWSFIPDLPRRNVPGSSERLSSTAPVVQLGNDDRPSSPTLTSRHHQGGLVANAVVAGALSSPEELRQTGGVTHLLLEIETPNALAFVPKGRLSEVRDLVLMGERSRLWNLQIIGCADRQEMIQLAGLQRAGDIEQAISDFQVARQLFPHDTQTSHALLVSVLKVIPDHYSARVLLELGDHQVPDRFSTFSSLFLVEPIVLELLTSLKTGPYPNSSFETSFMTPIREVIRSLQSRVSPEAEIWLQESLAILQQIERFSSEKEEASSWDQVLARTTSLHDKIQASWQRTLKAPSRLSMSGP